MSLDRDCTVRARMECLPEAIAVVESFCKERAVAAGDALRLCLIVDELFTNTVSHGYRGDRAAPVRRELQVTAPEVEISYADAAPPFDPLEHVRRSSHDL